MCCIFHDWVKVDDLPDEKILCLKCFTFEDWERTPERMAKYPRGGYCAHSVQVCKKCGKFKGYGSHGKLSSPPDICKRQVESMRHE
jgi:hypothetical protein